MKVIKKIGVNFASFFAIFILLLKWLALALESIVETFMAQAFLIPVFLIVGWRIFRVTGMLNVNLPVLLIVLAVLVILYLARIELIGIKRKIGEYCERESRSDKWQYPVYYLFYGLEKVIEHIVKYAMKYFVVFGFGIIAYILIKFNMWTKTAFGISLIEYYKLFAVEDMIFGSLPMLIVFGIFIELMYHIGLEYSYNVTDANIPHHGERVRSVPYRSNNYSAYNAPYSGNEYSNGNSGGYVPRRNYSNNRPQRRYIPDRLQRRQTSSVPRNYVKHGFDLNGLDAAGHDVEYYKNVIQEMTALSEKAKTQMDNHEYNEALLNVRLTIENGVRCVLRHWGVEVDEHSKIADDINKCRDYNLLPRDMINKLHSARKHCNDLMHVSGVEKQINQIFFCYKVSCELVEAIKESVLQNV